MPVLTWNESLALGQSVMDQTHEEFTALLNRLADVPEADAAQVLDEFVAHTQAHFAQEEQWMAQMAFPPLHCHAGEHQGVLEIAREVQRRVSAGEVHLAKVLAQATAEWFTNHAASMDAVLAMYMKQIDYQPNRDAQPNLVNAPPALACGDSVPSGGCHAEQPPSAATQASR